MLACSFRSWMGRGSKGGRGRDRVTHRLSRLAILALVALSTVLALPIEARSGLAGITPSLHSQP